VGRQRRQDADAYLPHRTAGIEGGGRDDVLMTVLGGSLLSGTSDTVAAPGTGMSAGACALYWPAGLRASKSADKSNGIRRSEVLRALTADQPRRYPAAWHLNPQRAFFASLNLPVSDWRDLMRR
jgi:hypothetical protein